MGVGQKQVGLVVVVADSGWFWLVLVGFGWCELVLVSVLGFCWFWIVWLVLVVFVVGVGWCCMR